MNEYSHIKDKLIQYIAEDPVYQIHEYSVDLEANHIYLVGDPDYNNGSAGDYDSEPGVEYKMATTFIKNLNILQRKNDDPILIFMKTCGGHWAEGMAIYDAIKACPNEIIILNYTHARSMSSLIFQAADKRVMMPHSSFMFHEGTDGFEGTVKQMRTEAKESEKLLEQMLKVYVDKLKICGSMKKWSKAKIKNWLIKEMDEKEEVYLNAEEAVKLGFADEIFGSTGVYDWKKLMEISE